MHNIVESQIIQKTSNELVVKIIKGTEYSDKDEANLIAAFRERLGDQIRIIIEYVEEIERTSTGKFRWVISNIPVQFSNRHIN
jgi:phenylacetate-CoA ligase